ncbi:MAG: FkbM family methyltransferase [Phycisphaerales bacterium]|nr:FkbM family methyltransferase [Phycisphaerales bacterium]
MSLKRLLTEFVRSNKHNLLHLKRLKFSYNGGDTWTIHHDRGHMEVSTYPYLACHDIEGYLKNGDWTIEPGQTVIDAGGCFGEFTMYASQCVGPTGRVLMMEPDAANIAVAQRNFALNGRPENITIVPAGLWHERGTIRFATGHDAQSSMVSDIAASSATMVEVPTLAMADLVKDYDLKHIDFFKMDIEGAELEALSVLKDLPADLLPGRWAIASYHPREGEQTFGRCEAILRDLGYTVSTGNERHRTTWASR